MTPLTGRMISTVPGYAKALAGFIFHSNRALGGPVSVALEPTNICNLRCPLCPTGLNLLTRPRGRMSFEAFKRIIDTLPSSVKELYLWGQGEPFKAPDFLHMVQYASLSGFKTIVSTNGHFLDNPQDIVHSGLDVLIVSLDGVDKDSYSSYRIGGDFNRVVNGIKSVAEIIKREGNGPIIELQYLVTKRNAGDIDAFKSLAHTIGAHQVVFKTMQAASLAATGCASETRCDAPRRTQRMQSSEMENGSSYLPDNMNLTRYRRNDEGRLETDRQWFLKNRCLRLYYSFQIDWQGNVLPCCFDKDSMYVMGNVFSDSVTHIWNSEGYRSFRDMLNRRGRVLPMCRDCTEGLKRMTLHV